MKKNNVIITGRDASLMMHAALRKCCDSKISSALYNFIYLQDNLSNELHPWIVFANQIAMRIISNNNDSRIEVFHDIISEDYELMNGFSQKSPGLYIHNTLFCILHCFNNDDIINMLAYI